MKFTKISLRIRPELTALPLILWDGGPEELLRTSMKMSEEFQKEN